MRDESLEVESLEVESLEVEVNCNTQEQQV